MTAIDARHERHMMRQRGAGARSIPTNFGFIFHAGPVQVSDTTAIQSPSSPNTRPIALAHAQSHNLPESSLPPHALAPKRKRVVREEEDDQIWFKKRTKKTTSEEQKEDTILTATLDATLDVTQQEPAADRNPVKRKIRKRILVPRPRQKDSLKPQPDQPTPQPEPVVEVLPPPNNKTNPSKDPQHVCPAEKSRKKAVPRKKLVRNHVQENVETVQPSLHESTQKITTLPLEEESIGRRPKGEATRQTEVVRKYSEKIIEQQIVEAPVDAQPYHPHEANPLPKKKKLVRRVRVPRTTKRATPEQNDSVNMVNQDDTKPSISTNNIASALLEAVAPAPIAKKPSKTPKRILFNNDSDIDLDQMLSGIAAIAESRGDTKKSTSKPSRAAKKKKKTAA